MQPINVLIYEPYPFGSAYGNLKTLSYITEFVDKTRYRLFILVPFESELLDRFRKKGVECIVADPPTRVGRYGGSCLKDNIFGRILTAIALIPYNFKLRGILKLNGIDVIYCNCIRSVLCVALAAKLCRIPMLWYIKGELNNRVLDRIGFTISDKILFFCESNKNDKYPGLVERYKNKIDILKIGIDPRSIIDVENKDKSGLTSELSISHNTVNIIVLGQLYQPKGIHYLLRSMAMIKAGFPDVKLYIVGHHVIDEYKAYKNELLDIIIKEKLEDHVVFTGWRSDALEILSLMDILVHPSLSEGFGRAVLEAMALGKPVVASRVGGLREIIRDGENGFLVDPADPGQIAKRLSTLLNDKDTRKRVGSSARATVFSEYMIKDKIERLEQIWAEMI